jgi:hypothetical protein
MLVALELPLPKTLCLMVAISVYIEGSAIANSCVIVNDVHTRFEHALLSECSTIKHRANQCKHSDAVLLL